MIHLTGEEPEMVDLHAALAESKAALAQLIAAGEKCGPAWATPRAAGKWSPSQIVEHVAMSLEESGKNIRGDRNAFPTLPRFLRPVVRALFFNRALKAKAFPSGKANKAMSPIAGPQTPADGRVRLQRAHIAFERACQERGDRFNHSIFGDVATSDYARFMAKHTLHHTKQIPGA
jgi:hypothetical protein